MLQPKSSLKKMNGSSTPGQQPVTNPGTNAEKSDKSNAPGKIGSLIRKAKEKATSLYNKSAGRTVSSVSKSFDGKEVQGKRVEKERKIGYGPIVQKGKTVKEVYKVPGAGKHIEKTRYNTSGDVVSKKVKDVGVNPSSFKTMKIEKAEKKIKRLKG